MSATSEYERTVQQDYGPTTSNENLYEHEFVHPLIEKMDVSNVRPQILRAVPLSPTQGDPEPDSTNPESIIHSVHKIDKDIKYHITEKRCESDMSVDTLPRIVRFEESNIENVSRISYPVIQATDDSGDGGYRENTATLIQAPLNAAIVHNVTKLPQNFTINVDATVGNIATIQNVSQDGTGNQTLWLPTILTTNASDNKNEENRQSGVSQIIITSESYINNTNTTNHRGNIITEASYNSRPKASKVQILSNISIPKNTNYSQQYVAQGKEMTSPVYGQQNHIYKLSPNLVPTKYVNNNIQSTKPPKSQSLISASTMTQTVINSSPAKNVPYSHTYTKSTNVNKVNNGANLNAIVAASSGNTHCHILSRVVSGPNKVSVHSGRKGNTLKGSKNSQNSGQGKNPRSIKIIQQTGNASKSENKTWPVASVTYKGQSNYNVETGTSMVIQKIGSPTHKNQSIALQKVPKGERLVLQSPCGPVLISTAPLSSSLPKGPHYVQSGSTANLQYVQTYGADNQLSTVSQISANQQLTAQILQSLSQPKLMLHQGPSPLTPVKSSFSPIFSTLEEPVETKPPNPKRIVFGDKTTLMTADDIIGVEERPNLSEELRRYSFQPLAFVMLDHTYALPAQKLPTPSTPNKAEVPTSPIVSAPPIPITTPMMSPLKRQSPTVITPVPNDIIPTTVATTTICAPMATTVAPPTERLPFKPLSLPPQDDDTASIISSVEGERRPPMPGGSDTETAPEGEEEGKTRCICDFTHDDGYMICCDRCGEWQHVDCMGIDRNNIPDAYMCELCMPRTIDRRHARIIQLRKREELNALAGSDSDSNEYPSLIPGQRRKRLLTVTTYTNTSGTCVTTYNSSLPVLPPPTPQPTLTLPKRGPKQRPKKTEVMRKGTKRKLTEKRVKRKKELMLNKSKFNSSMSSQSHWRDLFEQAMTNHYSPELRAKIMKYSSKLGNTSNMSSAITAHLCTTVPHAGGKILIATKDLRENTPVIELRGKYMLSNQHRPQLQNSARAGSQKPGPFVFFYRLPKDNTQICIDTRTYGNEARFVRRSCKPNAELQHCIVKGTLHVYLATITDVQSNTEITVGHDTNGAKQPCACGNPKHCKVNGLNTLPPRKSVDISQREVSQREKRSRNRCLSSSSPMSPPPTVTTPVTTPVKEMSPPFTHIKTEIKTEKKSPIKHEFPPMSPPTESYLPFHYNEPVKSEPVLDLKADNQEFDLTAKEEMKSDLDEPDYVKSEPEEEQELPQSISEPPPEPMEEEIKPIEEEMINEEPEEVNNVEKEKKVETEKKEEIIEEDPPKETVVDKIKEEPTKEEEKVKVEEPKEKVEEERPMTREFSAKSACHDRSSRSSRTCTKESDSHDEKTDDSQDKVQTSSSKEKEKRKMTREERKMEAIMKAFERMEKAQQRKQEVKERQKRRESDPHPTNFTEKDDDDDNHCSTKRRKRRKGRARTASQSNRRRLNSADSDMLTSGDEAPHTETDANDTPENHDTTDAPAPPRESLNEDIGLSSACLLVEAAVGSVESAFKLPKTKKTMATEWIGRSPDRSPSPYHSPYRPALVSAPSLESLVRVASTMIGEIATKISCDQEFPEETPKSPPRTPGREKNRPPKKAKRVTRSTPTVEVPEVTPRTDVMQHSAKKRWLRQAISEESDAPTIESPPNEMVTPLKKRRLARESLSYDQNPIVPCNDETSPSLALEDSPVKGDSLSHTNQYSRHNIMDYYSRDRTRSDSGQGSDDQCNIDHDILNVNIKGPHDSENIRRIIGVPTPEEELPPPAITKPEDIETTNNNNLDLEESNYNKVVPMDIDTTVIAQTKLESNENSNEVKGIESPNDKVQSSQSADTSGNSSPQRDEMDDIQKKIHSFHTENILILKSRNKKPPKEKRKKVNLNFDLNMVDDQISIQLRTENPSPKTLEVNGDLHDDNNSHDDAKLHVSPENIPLPPVESIPLPLPPENIPLPEETSPMPIVPPPETIPLPEEPMKPKKLACKPKKVVSPQTKLEEKEDRPSVIDSNSTVPFSTRFSSTGLFSGIFSNMSNTFKMDTSINDNIPNMSIIKSAIDRTTSLDGRLFDKDSISPVDDLKSVQEILTRVNNMDSNNSVILSGVLRGTTPAGTSPVRVPAAVSPVVAGAAPLAAGTAPIATVPCGVPTPVSPAPLSQPHLHPVRSLCSRALDPRLNPPPVDKPKPVRRKLSISEYRLRQLGAVGSCEEGTEAPCEGEGSSEVEEWSRSSASLSPQRLEAVAAAAADDLEQRLHRDLQTQLPAGVFNAQPTASERQREDLSSRLRLEYGLALPDDDARAPPDTDSSRRAR